MPFRHCLPICSSGGGVFPCLCRRSPTWPVRCAGLVLKEVGKRRNDCLSIDDVQVSGYDFDLEIDAEATMVRAECTEQTIRALQGALNGLTNMQREIIYLKYYEGLDNKSISEITGYADKTIRNVASTALARLRKDKMLGQAYG